MNDYELLITGREVFFVSRRTHVAVARLQDL